ncbi:MAG TPA: hypothetical protein VMH28_34515 [Candidatus Acidoferrales bacterium]|nr:hypothetical protein [Candidatus Acidoferrales bacterium]
MNPQAQGGQFGELRALWQARLDAARTAYQEAVAQMEIVLEQGDTAKGTPDPALTRRLALFREAAAREEYVRVLRIYSDLVVHNVEPAE